MIREIQEVAKEMISLNYLAHGKILSIEDLHIIENAIKAMDLLQADIKNLLKEASFYAIADAHQSIEVFAKIHKLLSLLAVAIDEIYTISIKLVCNYREEWDAMQKISLS